MTDLLLLAVGVLIVVVGAEVFFDAVLSLSSRLKTAPFVVTAIISGFELENLAVGIAANAKGLPGAAAGTFLGGTTFLALAVTGVTALISPLDTKLPWKPLAVAGISPLALVLLSLDGELSRLDGVVLLIWFIVVMTALARTGRSILGSETPDDEDHKTRPVLRVVGGLAALSIGGELLGEGIRGTVTRFGIPQTLLGNTVVAASVEAEEIARAAVPAKRGRPDVAVGNIVGTAVHFIAFNAGVIALVRPLTLDAISLDLHLPVAATSVVLVCALMAFLPRISRWIGGALLLCYAGYIAVAIAEALS
jgi:cation:H+ antiporter